MFYKFVDITCLEVKVIKMLLRHLKMEKTTKIGKNAL